MLALMVSEPHSLFERMSHTGSHRESESLSLVFLLLDPAHQTVVFILSVFPCIRSNRVSQERPRDPYYLASMSALLLKSKKSVQPLRPLVSRSTLGQETAMESQDFPSWNKKKAY